MFTLVFYTLNLLVFVQARYRGNMGAKGTGKVRAQLYGGTDKTVRGRYRGGTDW